MRSTYKKPLALLLSAALSFTLSGSPVYASNSSLLPETGTRSALPAQTATSSNAVTPSNAPAPVTPASTAAATATFSNAVESQDPVVSVDYISGTKEFTDIFEALKWIVPGVTFTLLRDTTITRQLKLDANVCKWDNITFDLNGYTLSGNFDDEAVVYFDPATTYHVGENSVFTLDTAQIKGVDSTVRETLVEMDKNSRLYVTERLMTEGDQTAESNIEVRLNGEDSSAQIISRSVGKGNSVQTFHPKAVGNNKCQAHIQCDSIIMDHAEIGSIPEIRARDLNAAIIHEAAIGRINDEQLLKLRTLGLTEEEAESVIIENFLN